MITVNLLRLMGCGKLFRGLMRIGLFSIGVACSSGYSMEQQMVTFKSLHGFPCDSIARSNRLWKAFPPQKKDDLRKKIEGTRDENLLFFFKLATQLAPETQNIIALYVMNGNPVQAKNFLNNSINDMVPRCVSAHEILNDQSLVKNFVSGFCDPYRPNEWKGDVIFGLLDEIVFLDKMLIDGPVQRPFTRRELEAFLAISSRFGRVKEQTTTISYREAYSLSNFYKKISEAQIMIFMALAGPVISAYIEQNMCIKIPNQKIIDENIRRSIANKALRIEYEKTGNLVYKASWKIDDPMGYSYIDWITIIVPHMCLMPIGLAMDKYKGRSGPSNYTEMVGATLGCAALSFLVSQSIYFGVSWLSQLNKNPLAVSGAILASYVLGCSLYNIQQMRSLKNDRVVVKNLIQWLNNPNIGIE